VVFARARIEAKPRRDFGRKTRTEIIFIRGELCLMFGKKGLSNGEPISISRVSEPGSAK
jgi:hypothetical protein